jgi:hypothetical protein
MYCFLSPEALIKFFEDRDEAHRFIILGPTGTSAALLNWSTCHSVLGTKDSMESDMIKGVTIKKVQEKLRGVEYIFLDEVSMVSCQSLYKISTRLPLALGEPEEAFGGMNMIFRVRGTRCMHSHQWEPWRRVETHLDASLLRVSRATHCFFSQRVRTQHYLVCYCSS